MTSLEKDFYRAMTDYQKPYTMFDDDEVLSSQNFEITPSGDKLYSMENAGTTGLFVDLLKVLMEEMNFTASLYMRQGQGSWPFMWH